MEDKNRKDRDKERERNRKNRKRYGKKYENAIERKYRRAQERKIRRQRYIKKEKEKIERRLAKERRKTLIKNVRARLRRNLREAPKESARYIRNYFAAPLVVSMVAVFMIWYSIYVGQRQHTERLEAEDRRWEAMLAQQRAQQQPQEPTEPVTKIGKLWKNDYVKSGTVVLLVLTGRQVIKLWLNNRDLKVENKTIVAENTKVYNQLQKSREETLQSKLDVADLEQKYSQSQLDLQESNEDRKTLKSCLAEAVQEKEAVGLRSKRLEVTLRRFNRRAIEAFEREKALNAKVDEAEKVNMALIDRNENLLRTVQQKDTELSNKNIELSEAQDYCQELTDKITSKQTYIKRLENFANDVENKNSILRFAAEKLADREKSLTERLLQERQASSQVAGELRGKVGNLERDLERSLNEKRAQDDLLESKQKEFEGAIRDLQDAQLVSDRTSVELDAAKEQLRISKGLEERSEELVSNYKSELESERKRSALKDDQLDAYQQDQEFYQKELSEKDEQLRANEEQRIEDLEALKESQDLANEYQETLFRCYDTIEKNTGQLETVKKESKSLRAKIDKNQKEKAQLESKLASLEERIAESDQKNIYQQVEYQELKQDMEAQLDAKNQENFNIQAKLDNPSNQAVELIKAQEETKEKLGATEEKLQRKVQTQEKLKDRLRYVEGHSFAKLAQARQEQDEQTMAWAKENAELRGQNAELLEQTLEASKGRWWQHLPSLSLSVDMKKEKPEERVEIHRINQYHGRTAYNPYNIPEPQMTTFNYRTYEISRDGGKTYKPATSEEIEKFTKYRKDSEKADQKKSSSSSGSSSSSSSKRGWGWW